MKSCHSFNRPVFHDSRGYFIEQFNSGKDSLDFEIQQISESWSFPDTFRGFHFQVKNKMNKIMRVVSGKAHVYAINLLNDSPKVEYFQLYSVEHTCTPTSLSNSVQYLYVPSHYAIGFITLEHTRMQYFHDTIRSDDHRSINVSCVADQMGIYHHVKHISDSDKNAMSWETWKSMKEEYLL